MPQLLPASAGTRDAVTAVTPGVARSFSSSCGKNARDRSCEYAFSSGDTAKVTRLSTFSPRSTRVTFRRLRVNSPAPTSNIIDSAICTVASDVRNREADLAPDDCVV